MAQMLPLLMDLARDRTAESRGALLVGLTDHFLEEIGTRNDRELQAFADIALILYPTAPMADRARLSRKVAVVPRTPKPLVMLIACDEIRIALPILECFTGFTQDDLAQLAATLSDKHLQVLARRSDIEFEVSNTLIRRGSPSVRRLLAGNREISLSQPGLKALVRHAVQDVVLREDLAQRNDLTPAVCELLIPYVRGATKQRLQSILKGIIKDEEETRFEVLRGLQQKYAVQLTNMPVRDLWNFAQDNDISLDDLIALLLQGGRFGDTIELLAIVTRTAKGVARNAVFNGNVNRAILLALDAEISLDSFSMIAKTRCEKLRLPQSQASEWIQSFVNALKSGMKGTKPSQGDQEFAARRKKIKPKFANRHPVSI